MLFNIKRYYHGIKQRKIWLLLILILPALYFILSAVTPDRFTVVQEINISQELPIIVSNPLDIKQVKDVISQPDILTHNSFSMKKLTGVLTDSAASAVSVPKLSKLMENQGKVLKETVRDGISIQETGENKIQIKYYGNDLKLGEILVGFYSERLLMKTMEGINSVNHNFPKKPEPLLSGNVETTQENAIWRTERSTSMGLMFLISIFCILILIGVMEWNDNSFKSERQIGRYLNMPVLGSIPDLNRMSKLMKMGNS